VHLMINNTESYKKCSKCPPPVTRHLLTRRTVFSKTVFSTARSTIRMYFVMAIFKSSVFLYFNRQVHTDFLIALYMCCVWLNKLLYRIVQHNGMAPIKNLWILVGHGAFYILSAIWHDSLSSPVTGLEWPRGFQEVKVPTFHDNGTGRW